MTRWQSDAQRRFQRVAIGLLIAALYALLCWATRKLSLDQFYLPAGVRVAALITVPPRQWIYLMLGEYAYFAHMRIPLIDEHGLGWVITGSVFIFPLVAGIVRLHQPLLRASDAWFLSIAIIAAVLVSLLNLAASHLLWSTPPPKSFMTDLVRFSAGDFIGVLTVAPIGLLWVRRGILSSQQKSHLAPSVAALTLLAALGLIALPQEEHIKATVQMLMLLPAVALTGIHGWVGAAVSVSVAHLLIGSSIPKPDIWAFDASIFGTQQALAMSGGGLLILGFLVSTYRSQCIAATARQRLTLGYWRTSQAADERRLRSRALEMQAMGDRIDYALSGVGDCLEQRGLHKLADGLLRISAANSRSYRDQTSLVYPTMLDHVGLYLTLQISGIAQVWNDTCRVGRLRLRGDPCQLSTHLQLMAYRVLEDAVTLMLENEPGQLQVRARAFRCRNRQGIMLCVGSAFPGHVLSDSTVKLAESTLTGRVLGYEGQVVSRRGRIRVFVLEDYKPGPSSHASREVDANYAHLFQAAR
jgi:hypothetical protein